MTRLFYENLDGPETHRPDILRRFAWDHLRPMFKYLKIAKRSMENSAWYIEWNPISHTELRQIFEESLVEIAHKSSTDEIYQDVGSQERNKFLVQALNADGYWVHLTEHVEATWVENILEQFIDSEIVYDVPAPFRRENKIQIISRLEVADAILLERKPQVTNNGERLLYLRPNTVNLRRQMEAIWTLQDKPHPTQRGLYRLLENKNHAQWEPVPKIKPKS